MGTIVAEENLTNAEILYNIGYMDDFFGGDSSSSGSVSNSKDGAYDAALLDMATFVPDSQSNTKSSSNEQSNPDDFLIGDLF